MAPRPRPQPADRYVDEFLRLPCAPEVLRAGVFPDAKELTESMAAFETVRRALIDHGHGPLLGSPDVVLYDVGSGRKPRTAVLAAYRTRWTCVAIDPMLDPEARRIDRVPRLRTVGATIEEYVPPEDEAGRFAVVTCVHSHAGLAATVEALRLDSRPGYCLVSIPCCVPHDLDWPWDVERDDWSIKSKDRRVYARSVLPGA